MAEGPKVGAAPGVGGGHIGAHFLLLTLLAAVLFFVGGVFGLDGSRRGALASLLALPGRLFDLVPVMAGLVVAAASPSARTTKHAVRLAVFAPLLMLTLDSVVGPPAARALSRAAREQHTRAPAPNGTGSYWEDESAIDTMGSAGALLSLIQDGQLAEVSETPDPTRADLASPRVIAIWSSQRLLHALLPIILIGLAVGLVHWLHSRVRFDREIDGRLAQFILGWTLVPLVAFLVSVWSHSTAFDALFEGGSMAILFVPYLPYAVVAAIGWRAVLTAARDMDP